MPLGIRGEWEWMRLRRRRRSPVGLAGPGRGGRGRVCRVRRAGPAGARARRASRWAEARWLAALLAAAIGVQVVVPIGAPDEYDLTKWADVNYLPGSTGYFKIAREQAAQDPWKFLARYPEWIREPGFAAHRHPPAGLDRRPVHPAADDGAEPGPGRISCRITCRPSVADRVPGARGDRRAPIRRSERAALYATALLTLLACAGTVVPLYLLARAAMPAPAAWAAAALWPLAPAANLFQPVADTAYPLLSTIGLGPGRLGGRPAARSRVGPRRRAWSWPALSGIVMAFGMVFTLAFLPVGLIVALILVLTDRALSLAIARRPDPGDGCRLPGVRAGRMGRHAGPIRSSSGGGTCTTTRGSTTNILAPIRSGSGSTRSSWRSRSGCRRSSGACVGSARPASRAARRSGRRSSC